MEGFSEQFYIRTTDVTGVITSLEKMSEDTAAITVIISVPVALESLCKVDGDMPDWFRSGKEVAMLALTARNQQKFLFAL